MPAIRIFEPALCCNTGVCGTDVDQALVDFTAHFTALKKAGVDIARTNLDRPGSLRAECAGPRLRSDGRLRWLAAHARRRRDRAHRPLPDA